MTQSSVAVSADGKAWAILNASPDIRTQLQGTPALQPESLRSTTIASVVVTNADVDHIAGLLTLREKTGFSLFATAEILSTLAGNSIFNVLDPDLVPRRPITLETAFNAAPGLTICAFSVPGKVALFLEKENVALAEIGEQTVGLIVTDGVRCLAYLPGCALIPDWLISRLQGIDLLLFDGTVWRNDDMQRTGTGEKTGARMGHVPMSGPHGSLARLTSLQTRKAYIHINNTNPVLQPNSPERAIVTKAGWEIAQDGMEFHL